MEIHPIEWPRLSGTLWYGAPLCWQIDENDETLDIVPADAPCGLMAFFVVLGLIALIGALSIVCLHPEFPDKGWVLFGGVGLALTMSLAAFLVWVGYTRNQARGPIFQTSLAAKEVRLPREGKVWPYDKIVRLEIVYGAWVRGASKQPHLFDYISELQMIVRNDAGDLSAWPIIGAPWRYPKEFGAIANAVARKMGLPLDAAIDGDKGRGD